MVVQAALSTSRSRPGGSGTPNFVAFKKMAVAKWRCPSSHLASGFLPIGVYLQKCMLSTRRSHEGAGANEAPGRQAVSTSPCSFPPSPSPFSLCFWAQLKAASCGYKRTACANWRQACLLENYHNRILTPNLWALLSTWSIHRHAASVSDRSSPYSSLFRTELIRKKMLSPAKVE